MKDNRYFIILSELDGIRFNEPLSKHTTFKIGGPADLFYEAKTSDDLVKVVLLCRGHHIPYFVLGGGSKILVSDKGFRGLVIKNRTSNIAVVADDQIEVDSGLLLPQSIAFALENGLSGFEFLTNIPGTVGGAIRENARFRDPRSFDEGVLQFDQVKDRWISDILLEVTILTSEDRIMSVDNEFCRFTYGASIFSKPGRHSKDVILSASFIFEKGSPEEIRERIRRFAQFRSHRAVTIESAAIAQPEDSFTKRRPVQPKLPSAGCIFSNIPNPENHPASRMIDLCGLRGTRVGGAEIAEEHANFIVNLGGATAVDVKALIELAKAKVWERFGLRLKEEIIYVGEWD